MKRQQFRANKSCRSNWNVCEAQSRAIWNINVTLNERNIFEFTSVGHSLIGGSICPKALKLLLLNIYHCIHSNLQPNSNKFGTCIHPPLFFMYISKRTENKCVKELLPSRQFLSKTDWIDYLPSAIKFQRTMYFYIFLSSLWKFVHAIAYSESFWIVSIKFHFDSIIKGKCIRCNAMQSTIHVRIYSSSTDDK